MVLEGRFKIEYTESKLKWEIIVIDVELRIGMLSIVQLYIQFQLFIYDIISVVVEMENVSWSFY